ncbi:MAG: hypothetical protein IKW35_06625, partial [Paludibacteraceae bacterium]|nr:hypothetical protein [Paludibacteraceae bacterium]
MKHFFSTLFVVFFAATMMAQTGLTCEDPIPVDENYTATITGPCELWYVANTYDLPLHVYFSPFADNSTWGPEVMIDFTCEEGVYDDPKLDSLVNMVSDFGLVFPVELLTDLVVRDGKNEWDLSVDKSYRERMAEFGITYNVKALVKVTFFEGGTISLKPDTLFKNCMETSEVIQLGDTIDILPNDVERAFIVSYSDWQKDSIRFVWEGEEPVQVWLAETMCDFEPSLLDPFVWNYFDITEETPYKLYSDQMKEDIKNHTGGGMFYGKIISSSAGKLVVEKIPMSKPKGDAELLEYGKQITVAANDANALYCFPKKWTSTEFVATSNRSVEMYVSNQADFSFDGTNVLTTCSFDTEGSEKVLYLSTKEIADFAAQASDDYIYVRFKATSTISIMPNAWETLACLEHSVQINPNVSKQVSNTTNATVYRFRYDDFSGYDMTIKWNGNGILPVYLADTCVFELTELDENVLIYNVISRRGSYVVSAATLDEWATRVGEEGYLYARFDNSVSSRVTFQTEKPEDIDPVTPDSVYTSFDATVCFGEAYDWNGQTYNETGEYTQTFAAANGADSIVTLNLTVLPEVPVTKEKAAVCYGETYTWQGQEYTESGEYSVILQDVNGCDSVITLALTVYPQTPDTTEEVTIKFGESYEWNGETYSAEGEYTTILQDANGCDYQATLILTVLPEEKPEEDGTILLNPTDELVLNLDSAVNVYRTDYDVWSAAKVQLGWYGDKPLHVFVSK